LKKNILIIISMLIVANMLLFSQTANGEKIVMTGIITVVGNEPFTYLVIESEDVSYSIVGDMKNIIWNNYQGKKIKVEGIVLDKRDMFSNQLKVTKIF
jgi:hypothetical protein